MALFDQINIGGSFSSYLNTFRTIIFAIIIAFIFLVVLLVIVLSIKRRRSFNIPLVIITPRSDGRVVEINRGMGGYFKSKRLGSATTFKVKRKGLGTCEIPPPESVYLTSPTRTLVLVQKGLDDYEPVLPESLSRVEIPDGRKIPILKLKAKNQDATAWSYDIETTAKQRFTFIGFWDKYQQLITFFMFIFILFLILYINWIGMKDVVAGLSEVAKALKGTSIPVVS